MTDRPPPKRDVYILLIEDEPVIINLIQRFLGSTHLLLIAKTIADAEKELQSEKEIGVILFDYTLPDGSSVPLIETLHKIFKGYLVSITANPNNIEAMREAGCQLHVDKIDIRKMVPDLVLQYLARNP